MAELQGKAGELRFTVEVKRKATGKVEIFELIGTHLPDEKKETK
jgi:hypothetical protein